MTATLLRGGHFIWSIKKITVKVYSNPLVYLPLNQAIDRRKYRRRAGRFRKLDIDILPTQHIEEFTLRIKNNLIAYAHIFCFSFNQ